MTEPADLVAELGKNSVDVVIDLVVGSNWSQLLDVLKVGGRYSTVWGYRWSNS